MLSNIDTTPLVTIVSDYGVTSVPSLSEHSRFQSEHLADAARPIGIGATTWAKGTCHATRGPGSSVGRISFRLDGPSRRQGPQGLTMLSKSRHVASKPV